MGPIAVGWRGPITSPGYGGKAIHVENPSVSVQRGAPSGDEQATAVDALRASASGGEPAFRSPFVRRVVGVFGTRITQFLLLLAGTIVISVFLAPGDKGLLVAVTGLPFTLSAIGMIGLPSAVNYFAGKGSSIASLTKNSYVFTALLSVIAVGVIWLALPWLESSFLSAARGHDEMLRVILLTLPLSILSAFGGWILYGRQAVRVFNTIQIAQSAITLICAIVLVGVLRLGVWGAIAGNVIANVLFTVAVMYAVRQLGQRDHSGSPVPRRTLISYGARLYPASISSYFNFSADTYLLQALIMGSAYPLGLYNMAVKIAQIVFYVPDSMATIFLPRVAASSVEDSNRMLGQVSRMCVLLTMLATLFLVPVAFVGIHVVLPLYAPCLPAFYVLLPGVVTLSLAKVMASYLAGRGRPELLSLATMATLAVNVTLNLALIPRFGIVGASLSSLVSYTFHAITTLLIASRMSGESPLSLLMPGRAEVGLLVAVLRRLGSRARSEPSTQPEAGGLR